MGDIVKSVGKNTLGGGKKINVNLHTYNRSTHNRGYVFRNTQDVGTLVPFLCELETPGDIEEIELSAVVLTHPTVGPLYGSYKLQMDVFTVPIRLYNALLHNNALNIGMDIKKVKFPVMEGHVGLNHNPKDNNQWTQIHPSCVLHYLGQKGFGRSPVTSGAIVTKQCIPMLGYYDIFKNYYANKQEKTAYYIRKESSIIQSITLNGVPLTINDINTAIKPDDEIIFKGQTLQRNNISMFIQEAGQQGQWMKIEEIGNVAVTTGKVSLTVANLSGNKNWFWTAYRIDDLKYILQDFPLENIDKMRELIYQAPTTAPFVVTSANNGNLLPYTDFKTKDDNGLQITSTKGFGLCLKTYQSDIKQNWIDTEFIDGINGISNLTAIDTSTGQFTIDTLNLAQKVYNMMNRIAISDGSYKSWVETVYTNGYVERSETPVYQGGMSQEIIFEEVISQSATAQEPLGTLAGRGRLKDNKKGGRIHIRVDEPSFLIGICSITPRIDYSQGNEFYTYLETLDDLHKPALDGIGYQDLVTGKLAWWDDFYLNGTTQLLKQYTAGKQPAWLDYMTNTNKIHGEFAIATSEQFMVLDRNYEFSEGLATRNQSIIQDLTTYVSPNKYNYVFADTEINSQNFWVQIGVNMISRRKMSAKIIPNL